MQIPQASNRSELYLNLTQDTARILGADGGVRTHGLLLGKQTLLPLSYTRVSKCRSLPTVTPIGGIYLTLWHPLARPGVLPDLKDRVRSFALALTISPSHKAQTSSLYAIRSSWSRARESNPLHIAWKATDTTTYH